MRRILLTLGILAPALVARGNDAHEWENGPGYRSAPLRVPAGGKTGFTLLPAGEIGIAFTNTVSNQKVAERQNLMNGAGLAAGDFDNDGLCDLYFCNKQGSSKLFKNLGNWRFQDVTDSAGVACANQSSSGATFADVNGDGFLDLIVTSFGGPNACFINDGKGHFANATAAAGLTLNGNTTSMALGDIDLDGHLDLYVCNFAMQALLRDGALFSTRVVNGQTVVTGRFANRLKVVNGLMIEMGEPDYLFRNNGQGLFAQLPWTEYFRDEDGAPMSPPLDFGLAVQIRDINGDGFPDIYVCDDFQTPDRVWLNDGKGHFRAIDRLAIRNMSYASMGVDFADLDRDGKFELFTVEMLSRDHARHLRHSSPMQPMHRLPGQIENREEVARNALYWNRGDGTYAEIAQFAGVNASDWSWTPIFLDVDLDGYEDLLVSNGHMRDVNDLDVNPTARGSTSTQSSRTPLTSYPVLDSPKAAFRNNHDLTFEDTSDKWGFNSRQIGHGMALADLDGDGDMDVIVACVNAPPLIYRNETAAPRLAVRLRGSPGNIQGIGALIRVLGGPVPQSQQVICGGRYLAGDDPVRVFAAGGAGNKLSIEVTWPDGRRSVVADAVANRIYEIDRAGATTPTPAEAPKPAPPLFEDRSALLAHSAPEGAFNDFERQPLLTKRLSQGGPGLAWFDFDGDGHEDLAVGAARGGLVAAFKNDGKGSFSPMADSLPKTAVPDDTSGLVGYAGAAGRLVLAGLSAYESGNKSDAVLGYALDRMIVAGPPRSASDPGPLALADVSGDGTLQLFVGGRCVPGSYPSPASSFLFRTTEGQWAPDQETGKLFKDIGLVNGAVWSDLNQDGFPDLILACDWGAIRVFLNEKGKLREATEKLGLGQYKGWWNGVTVGDFDGDGRMDIVACNWGQNSPYQNHRAKPLRLYYGDLEGKGSADMVEAFYDPASRAYVPERWLDSLGLGLLGLRSRFASHREFAESGIEKVLGDSLKSARVLEANWLETTVFLNRGDRFEARALPKEAQWAPAFGVTVADFDGDGAEDIFLAQNFFACHPETSRYDGGRGLLLKGDGKGSFAPVPGQESGLKVYGEQRGCAAADFDEDGRVDLAVTQNGSETKLFRNLGARPGLRVRLRGPAGNPDAIGAQIRLVSGESKGPAREIHAGSGYWSQDGAVQVMSLSAPPTSVEVRWPGGKTTSHPVPTGAREMTIQASTQK